MIAHQFGIPLDSPFVTFVRFMVICTLGIIVICLCNLGINILKYVRGRQWNRDIYTLLTVIKVREARTIEAQEKTTKTHEKTEQTLQKIDEKTEQTLQKIDEKANKIEEKILPLIESNPSSEIQHGKE